MMKTIKHLYIHVPFCKTICSYCDFCHSIYNKNKADLYLNRLQKDLSTIKDESYSTIYIGGGTPSCLEENQIDRLLSMIEKYSLNVEEYTFEVNPENIDENKVQLLKKHGVNRVSIGLQSSNNRLLKLMNRHHSFDDVKKCVEIFKNNGINNISIDVMYSLPTQSMEDLKETLDNVLSLDVPHVSLYSLTIEKGTAFDKLGYETLDSEIEADMYEYIENVLLRNCYVHYEIANFAKKGFESRHNIGYWDYDDYRGLGPGATGKYGHKRYVETKDIDTYINELDTAIVEEISNKDEAFENIMMSLRTNKGLDLKVFKERYGFDFLDEYRDIVEKNKDNLLINDNKCICTNMEILNTILVDFID